MLNSFGGGSPFSLSSVVESTKSEDSDGGGSGKVGESPVMGTIGENTKEYFSCGFGNRPETNRRIVRNLRTEALRVAIVNSILN